MRRKKQWSTAITYTVLTVFLLLFLSPLVIVLFGAFKSYGEIMTDAVALPTKVDFQNFANVFRDMNYPNAIVNTILVTLIGTAGIVIVGALAGYMLSRTKTKLSFVLYILCIIPMMIPFQSYMITLVQIAKLLKLTGSIWGLSVIYWGLGTPLSVFLFHGFVKSVPRELDECATIDGCSRLRAFVSVIFPLLKPVTATVIVVNAMWIWNDFLLPLLIIGGSKTSRTLQLAAYGFVGQYKMQWNNIMAGAILIIVPALLIYLIFQKKIIKGMVDGSVKG